VDVYCTYEEFAGEEGRFVGEALEERLLGRRRASELAVVELREVVGQEVGPDGVGVRPAGAEGPGDGGGAAGVGRRVTLPENSALPCVEIARQRVQNARQRLCHASTHGNARTAMYCPATDSLPCVSSRPLGNAFAVLRNLCRASYIVAVREYFAVCLTPLPCA
jgi:hypothetical protein